MNYLKLINQFWKLRRSKRITNMQADLYFFLIQECNERDWENPFECSNKLIIASIPITEPSLIDARNRLKQLGLIDFISGKRNESSPIYTITYLNNLSRNRVEGLVESLDEPEKKAEPIRDKPNKTKPKPNKTEKGADAPEVFKKIELVHPFSENFLPQWIRWKEYKKIEHRFLFKSIETEQAALDELIKLSGGAELSAIEHINYAIAKGWKGHYPIKNNQHGTTHKSGTKPVPQVVGQGGFGSL